MKMNPFKLFSRTVRGRWRRKLLSRFGIGVVAETKNGLLLVDPGDFVVSRALLERGEYDCDEIASLLAIIGENPATVVVIGVHIGAVLIPLAKKAGRVIGFESNPPTFKLARINVLLNELTNVRLENCAIGMQSGIAAVVNNPVNTGNSSISVSAAKDPGAKTVTMVTLDHYCKTEAIQTIDLLMLDIEGHEYHALRGAESALKRTTHLYMEYAPAHLKTHGTDPAELIAFVLARFEYVHVFGKQLRSFRAAEGKEYLRNLPDNGSLLLNLLLTNRQIPEAALRHYGHSSGR